MKKVLFLSAALSFLLQASWAQQEILVTKEEIQKAAAEQNLSVKISEQDFYRVEASYRQTHAAVMPNVGVSYTGFTTTNPLMAFGSKLNQEILTEGDFNPRLLNDPSSMTNYALAIEVQQPLINLDGIFQRKAAKTRMEAAALQTARTKQHLAFEVDQYYMQLQLAYHSVEVLSKALESSRANKKLAEDNYRQGYSQRADVLAAAVRVMEVQDQLQNAESTIRDLSDHLVHLTGEERRVLLKPADSLYVTAVSIDDIIEVPGNRADIKAREMAAEAYASAYRANKMSFLPRLNAFGSYQLYDESPLAAGANGYVIGAQLSWNILEGTKRIGQVQESKALLRRSELEYEQYVSQSRLEMSKARRMLADAQHHLALSGLSVDHAHESLRIRTDRFREGLEKTTDLLQAETTYAQKQLEYYQAVYRYNYALAYIQFLTRI